MIRDLEQCLDVGGRLYVAQVWSPAPHGCSSERRRLSRADRDLRSG